MCKGRGTLEPDPDAFLLEEFGDTSSWLARKANAFYAPFLPPESAELLSEVQRHVPSSLVEARYIRSQTVRIIGLADTLHQIGKGNDILIMLLAMVAENVAKLWFGFDGDRESKKYFRLFFMELTPPDVQAALVLALQHAQVGEDDPFAKFGFSLGESQPIKQVMDINSAVDLLYDVRCDVVHEGRYRQFLRPGTKLGETTYLALRECVVRGSIAVLEKCVQKAHAAAAVMKEIRRQGMRCADCQTTFVFADASEDDIYWLADEYASVERRANEWVCESCREKGVVRIGVADSS